MKNIRRVSLIQKGICPFCKKQVYDPSSTTEALAYHIAVGLHMGKCKENPNNEESEFDALMKSIFGDRE